MATKVFQEFLCKLILFLLQTRIALSHNRPRPQVVWKSLVGGFRLTCGLKVVLGEWCVLVYHLMDCEKTRFLAQEDFRSMSKYLGILLDRVKH